MRKKLDLPKEEIWRKYMATDMTYRDLAKEYGCSYMTIARRIKEKQEEIDAINKQYESCKHMFSITEEQEKKPGLSSRISNFVSNFLSGFRF